MQTKYVVSLELAKRLKELGCKQESDFYWEQTIGGDQEQRGEATLTTRHLKECCEKDKALRFIPAYHVGELGELLKGFCTTSYMCNIRKQGESEQWGCARQVTDDDLHFMLKDVQFGNTEADARAKLLIYMIEQGLLDAPK